MRTLGTLVFLGMLMGGLGCGGGKLPQESKKDQAALPEGHPPVDGSAPMGGGALGATGIGCAKPVPAASTIVAMS